MDIRPASTAVRLPSWAWLPRRLRARVVWRLNWTFPACRLYVRRGTSTDLASVPRIARVALSTTGLGIRAPLVHDVLHRTSGRVLVSEPAGVRFTFREAIHVLVATAIEDRVPAGNVALAWAGLWLGGWWDWYIRPRRARPLSPRRHEDEPPTDTA